MNVTGETLKCRTLIIKVASRCNLNCRYCYMYNMGDSTYKGQPKVMSNQVVEAMVHKVKLHCLRHQIKKFFFIFHGGEPLLAGKDFFKNFVDITNACLLPEIKPDYHLQTNGVLLTEEWCQLFSDLDIIVGLSLDGTKEENNKFRVYHTGKGAYDEIVHGLMVANNHPHFKRKPGVISVININADPEETYQHFKDLKIEFINFLMPDSTYDHPPVKPAGHVEESSYYADWLIKIFDKWFYDAGKKPVIRMFQTIIQMILGENLHADNLGTQHNQELVIETDGSIEAVDILKICGNGFTKAGANVLTHELDESMQTELAKLFYMSHKRLCKKCLCCPVNEVCGGGYLPHRYSKKNGFNNPSVYCNDLLKLITHIQNAVFEQIPQALLQSADLHRLTYEEAKLIIDEEMGEMTDLPYMSELEQF